MILSVDTGLNNFGLAVIGYTGSIIHVETIKTHKTSFKGIPVSKDMCDRITLINRRLHEICKEYTIFEVTGEMPTFGAKSSNAAVAMSTAATIILGLCAAINVKPIWESPRRIKQHFTGIPDASKKQIMEECCRRYSWEITYNVIRTKEGNLKREDPVYHVLGQTLSANTFEHIADAIAAYHTCKA